MPDLDPLRWRPDVKTVVLHGPKAAGRVALVSDEDYELVSQYKWRLWEIPGTETKYGCGPYAISTFRHDPTGRFAVPKGRKKTIRMHALIMGVPGADHIDHDGLNNQRSNLRIATKSQNNHNQRPQRNVSSQFKGVCRMGPAKWIAYITLERRHTRLGEFRDEIEAAYAYDTAAREHFGEFACLNFPEPPTQAMRDEWEAQSAERRRAAARRSAATRAGRLF